MTALRPMADAPEPRAARLESRGIAFRYGERRVLEDVSFTVAAGEIFGILGPNGAGKSTLFAILAGLRRPGAGTLSLDGEILRPGSRELRARLGVAFQDPSLDPKLTCEENLRLAAQLHRVPRAESRRRCEALLAAAGLAERARDPAERLSGGLRRRLELARALVHRPSVLLVDEPTSGLDAAAFRAWWAAVEAARRDDGLTVILATHRPDEAERCDRLAVLARGRIVACDAPDALRARVSGDVIEIEAEEPAAVAVEISRRFGVPARVTERGVALERSRGHELVPRLVEAFPAGRLRSVSLRPPALSDAFLAITGEALDREEDA
ncbi:MAG TPA: ABC transporter ATP-binding protein [Anaeromyxobacteraceae bacterium]|nr:ABC transporter ATP-binding protein [Anaeromyxobacteraceae bacterium]